MVDGDVARDDVVVVVAVAAVAAAADDVGSVAVDVVATHIDVCEKSH